MHCHQRHRCHFSIKSLLTFSLQFTWLQRKPAQQARFVLFCLLTDTVSCGMVKTVPEWYKVTGKTGDHSRTRGKIQLFSELWGWLSHINIFIYIYLYTNIYIHINIIYIQIYIYKYTNIYIFGRAGIFPINCVWKGLVYLYRHPLDYITQPPWQLSLYMKFS